MKNLIREIKQCTLCENHLPLGANPIFSAGAKSKLLIIGQAPGRIVHQTHIPWNDKSGDNLRNWLGIDTKEFYDTNLISLMPMGFCYPGTGKSGDLPPRPECAPEWHSKLIKKMPHIELIIVVGNYSMNYYLGKEAKENLTETVKQFSHYLPLYFPLPHPSPRNNLWQAKNPWFVKEVLPELKKITNAILRY